jgi:hypothetical protein
MLPSRLEWGAIRMGWFLFAGNLGNDDLNAHFLEQG